MNFDIVEYGAKPDANFLNTKAIQDAIDCCHDHGGGRVTVPVGTFMTGSIFLKDNVELHLEHGAVLLGSPDVKDYNALDAYPQNYSTPYEQWLGYHLIIASYVKNAAITGQGTINGNGTSFFEENPYYDDNGKKKTTPKPAASTAWRNPLAFRMGCCLAKDKEKLRPGQMIVFAECSNIVVRDVSLVDSPCWSIFFHGCEDVRVSGVRIDNPLWHSNTDGIDIDCCKNVVVSDCLISTGDDALTLRGCCHRLVDKTKVCENISVSNCVIRSGVNGIRVGVGFGIIRNAVFSNIAISSCAHVVEIQEGYHTYTGGVDISGILFSNLTVRDAGMPVSIHAGSDKVTVPIRDITFSHCSFEAFHGFEIIGSEKLYHENITFDDVFVRIISAPEDNYKNDENFPGFDLPEYFVNVQYTENLHFRAVRFQWATTDPWWKGLTRMENNENLRIDEDCQFPEKGEK